MTSKGAAQRRYDPLPQRPFGDQESEIYPNHPPQGNRLRLLRARVLAEVLKQTEARRHSQVRVQHASGCED